MRSLVERERRAAMSARFATSTRTASWRRTRSSSSRTAWAATRAATSRARRRSRASPRTLPAGTRPTPDEVIAAIDEANAAVRALSGRRRVRRRPSRAPPSPASSGCACPNAPTSSGWSSTSATPGSTLWDGARLRQLSVDHSAVQELVDAGLITAGAGGRASGAQHHHPRARRRGLRRHRQSILVPEDGRPDLPDLLRRTDARTRRRAGSREILAASAARRGRPHWSTPPSRPAVTTT